MHAETVKKRFTNCKRVVKGIRKKGKGQIREGSILKQTRVYRGCWVYCRGWYECIGAWYKEWNMDGGVGCR